MTLNSTTNSYAILIRDGMLAKLKTLPFYKDFYKFRRSKQMQIQPEQIPLVGCYVIDETMTPDGDVGPRTMAALA